ncbi:kinesin-associated protein 3 [Macrosteles quadrilineatus]|uniref:kinesin-associated protein 3 n=1 Tax=Macrosteles quadrilineatus TaxID=74068 RepID=UPI0023E1E55C|nr:kinesin-associated protein 3 [Macrosteles quadrilineatus]
MQPEDARYIKRRVRSGSIDVHPTETALIVNYELEAIILGECGEPMVSEKKECQKIIRLKRLDAATDCAALAKEVVQKCTLIHPSKTAEVEHLIYYLQSRKDNAFTESMESCMEKDSGSESPSPAPTPSGQPASFTMIESYMELLYEDLPDKTKGSALILELAKDPNNLEDLASSEAVLSALARVLREDWKKNLELSTNIVYTFFCFSTFSQFHPIIQQYKVGSLCLEIIEYELNRYAQLRKEVESRGSSAPLPAPVSRLPLPRSARRPIKPSADDKKKIPKEKVEEPVMNVRKLATLAKKQDQLLRVCFYLLLNLAENMKVEDKMRRRNLVGLLVTSLERSTQELLVLVASFLLKLSVYKENKDEMANLNVIEKLPKLLLMKDKNLELVTLNLLFNLSFDSNLREKMVRVGFLPKLVSMLGDEEQQVNVVVLKLLYHLSLDDRVKAMFAYTDCIPKVVGTMVGQEPGEEVHTLSVALMVNLALHGRCAAQLLEGNNLQYLIECAFHHQSSIIVKILRNASVHDNTKHLFIDFVGDLANVVATQPSDDFTLECVGLLANLTLAELDYSTLLQQYNLVSWITRQLVPGNTPDDLVLEVIMLVSTAALDESCASLLCKADILLGLIELLKAKQEDDEIVLQIVYVFYQIARHATTRDYLIRETEAPAYLIDLMHDKNENIRKVCDACLEIIKECDEVWAEKIKTEQFEWHNSHWLSMVDNKALDSVLGDDSDILPHYDLLQQSLLLRTGSQSSLNGDDIEIVSNHPQSDEGSRPISGYASSELDDVLLKRTREESQEDVLNNALRNLVISEDNMDDDAKYFHIQQSS